MGKKTMENELPKKLLNMAEKIGIQEPEIKPLKSLEEENTCACCSHAG